MIYDYALKRLMQEMVGEEMFEEKAIRKYIKFFLS